MHSQQKILGGLVGGVLGVVTAQKVPMTAMPETVALFNGCGGMSSLLVAIGVAIFPITQGPSDVTNSYVEIISIIVSILSFLICGNVSPYCLNTSIISSKLSKVA